MYFWCLCKGVEKSLVKIIQIVAINQIKTHVFEVSSIKHGKNKNQVNVKELFFRLLLVCYSDT